MRHISRFIYELIRVTISIQWKVSFFMFCFKWKYTIITTQKKKNIYIYIWINFKEGLKVNCPFQNEFPWKFSLSMFGIINTFLFLNFKVSQSIPPKKKEFFIILFWSKSNKEVLWLYELGLWVVMRCCVFAKWMQHIGWKRNYHTSRWFWTETFVISQRALPTPAYVFGLVISRWPT